jgi:hypothetical protein
VEKVLSRRLSGLAFPKADAADPRVEPTWQIIPKWHHADVALHDTSKFRLPTIGFKYVVAEGPIVIVGFPSQFYRKVIIAVWTRRASCSATEQPKGLYRVSVRGPF